MTATTRHLGVLDTAFLDVEDADPHVSLAIGSVLVLDGPPPDRDEFTARVGPRLLSLPDATATVRRGPLGAPELVESRRFSLDHHVRRVAVTAPGDDAALHDLVASIMEQRLDREHPLWECWVVEGLAGGRWAVVFKVHHCLVDGVGGVDLLTALCTNRFSTTTVVRPVPRPPLRAARRVVRGAAELIGAAVPVATSSLIGPIGSRRRYRVVRTSLPEVAAVGRAFGATVNDVVLTAVSAGLRDLLVARGEPPCPRAVRALVPVSVRDERTGSGGNAVSVRLPFLPIHITDPLEALGKVHRAMRHRRGTGESDAGQAFLALARHACPRLLSSGVRLGAHLPQRSITTVTTNVPGPRHALTLAGRAVTEILPYVPLALDLRTGIAALTYQDNLTMGITGDRTTTPDLDVLATGITQELHRLTTLAAPSCAPSPSHPGRPSGSAPKLNTSFRANTSAATSANRVPVR
ncbi:wax ester/triacylglycerol synthase domain-containing protein [Saccharothrix sp. NPDC042600]|uniref:wax ester/triacylglycerol synthase domain-containing protein n=1 Tax=Saccharothrix TaxID=2071 RepID=UPI0033CBF254|nr:diacyglycerol O-acyltransferase [Saccharothrix mutabilis subsp. capreolus]